MDTSKFKKEVFAIPRLMLTNISITPLYSSIKYEVGKMLRSFISLSKYDLISCAKEWRANKKSFQSALDYIYLSKDIIIKQDVLIS